MPDFAHQPFCRLVRLTPGFLTELPEELLQVPDVPPGLVDVVLDGALELRVGSPVNHLYLSLEKAVLGIVELAQLLQEQLPRIGDGHSFSSCRPLAPPLLITPEKPAESVAPSSVAPSVRGGTFGPVRRLVVGARQRGRSHQ